MKVIEEILHHKQEEFFENNSRNRWIFGGNRTGKTHAGAEAAVRWAVDKPATEGWVVSLSTQVQRDVAQRKVLELLDKAAVKCTYIMLSGKKSSPRTGVIDFLIIDHNGSRIGFRNCEQGREKFQGTKLDWLWFDEEPPEDIYEECLVRTLDKGGYVWGTMTPLKGRTWVYERIFLKANDDDIWVRTWTWEDNGYLNKDEMKRMERLYSAETLETRKYGRFMEGQGIVFSEFDEKNIVKNVSKMLQEKNFVYTGISIDPGYTSAVAVLWFGIDGDDNIFVIDEYKDSYQSIEQIAHTIERKSNALGVPVENVFIDSASTAQVLGEPASVAEQFQRFGVPVDPRVDKNVIEGIHRVKGLFKSAAGIRKLFVCEHCVHLVRELRGYFWGDRDRPVKKDDHCIDALRYFVMSINQVRAVRQPPTPKNKTSKIEQYKRRIIHGNNY